MTPHQFRLVLVGAGAFLIAKVAAILLLAYLGAY